MPQEVANRCQFRPCDVVANRYAVRQKLGEGSFGVVYMVEGCDSMTYALKLLKLWEVPAEIRQALVCRFDMEYETGRINSPYLVHSQDHGFVEGNPYIVMDFCKDGDLISIMGKEYLDYDKVGYCVLNGLKALHECGKVHRDLKPENVLRNSQGDYVLTDFGISGDRNKRMTERNILGKPKQILGTYAYMPPEQSSPQRDATVLPTTDIFSFGVMMFQLLTGSLPFGTLENERDLVAYIRNIKSGNWDRALLDQTRDGMAWKPVIERCLIPDYTQRAQSVDVLLDFIPKKVDVSFNDSTVQMSPPAFQTEIKNGLLLKIMQGEEYGMVYYLDYIVETTQKWVLLMGRRCTDVRNDIPIKEDNSSYISRRHCTLELDYDLGEWILRDGQFVTGNTGTSNAISKWVNSTNGTYINSSEVTSEGVVIKPGDIISIGDTKLRVEAY